MDKIEKYVQDKLFGFQDLKYKKFHCKLIPNVNPDTVIGVRTPVIRKFAKEFAKNPQAEDFMKILPHKYYEENNLHGFLIENIKDYDKAIDAIDSLLPYIDNWATCDLISPKIFKKNTDKLLEKISEWINSDKTYTVRFGIEMLMSFYLDEKFTPKILEMTANVRSDEYYINMMIAWFFATAIAKQEAAALPYIKEYKLDKWTHNKTIQKCVESYRITPELKTYLKALKVK